MIDHLINGQPPLRVFAEQALQKADAGRAEVGRGHFVEVDLLVQGLELDLLYSSLKWHVALTDQVV